jgi:Asp-tRNA(Asn)/Glu-tRNA(Gln) amidotransferase A subunit family amidase
MVPIAVGTQTVASLNRPAAYCGIAAFKPSTRSLSTYGITPLGPSYDTPGLFGWSVADAVAAYQAIAPAFLAVEPPAAPAKLAVCIPDDPHIAGAIPEMKAALTRVADAFANAGHAVERTASPISFERLYSLQRSTMAYEAGRALRHLLKAPAGCVGEKLTALIREGLAIAANRYLDERCAIDRMRETLFAELEADVFLWPAIPASAPEGLGWTGDVRLGEPTRRDDQLATPPPAWRWRKGLARRSPAAAEPAPTSLRACQARAAGFVWPQAAALAMAAASQGQRKLTISPRTRRRRSRCPRLANRKTANGG